MYHLFSPKINTGTNKFSSSTHFKSLPNKLIEQLKERQGKTSFVAGLLREKAQNEKLKDKAISYLNDLIIQKTLIENKSSRNHKNNNGDTPNVQ